MQTWTLVKKKERFTKNCQEHTLQESEWFEDAAKDGDVAYLYMDDYTRLRLTNDDLVALEKLLLARKQRIEASR